MKKKVLFICVHNSARSQMAAAWLNEICGDYFEAESAGLEPGELNPLAVQVMDEVGIDISNNKTQAVFDVFKSGQFFPYVITVCDESEAAGCPIFPGVTNRLHWSFPDPSALVGTQEEWLEGIRKIRDGELKRGVTKCVLSMREVMKIAPTESSSETVREEVRRRYGATASDKSACADACCTSTSATALGYSAEDQAAAPEAANLGLGCGNPLAIASLKQGQVVLDLGSGAGFDCFLAARAVGKSGKVIGVDMTHEMLGKARENAQKNEFTNVEFRLGEIEALPAADNSVDVIISNCVINLSPEKQRVFNEAFRVLKSGGRLAVADMVATASLPNEIKSDWAAYTGCIAGASEIVELEQMLGNSGFKDIKIAPKDSSRSFIREWLPGKRIEDYLIAATIEAVKP